MKSTSVNISGTLINNESPAYIIAELSANHAQDIDIAYKSIEAISKCGVNAVKVQTYTPDTMTLNSRDDIFMKKDGLWKGKSLYELYEEAFMPWDWQSKLKEYATSLGLTFFSSPFDNTSVDFLEEMNVPAYKIASFEITDIELLRYVASKGKPIIISTGIATIDEIQEAVNICKSENNEQVILLKCTSAYPAPLEEANLKMIQSLANTFNVISGFSDHTLGITAPIAAIAMGAKVIEKHFILDKSVESADAKFSLNIDEFKIMVQAIRDTEKLLGTIDYTLSTSQKKARNSARSIFVTKEIQKGEAFTKENIKVLRPANGLSPKYYQSILGKTSNQNIIKHTPLHWEYIK